MSACLREKPAGALPNLLLRLTPDIPDIRYSCASPRRVHVTASAELMQPDSRFASPCRVVPPRSVTSSAGDAPTPKRRASIESVKSATAGYVTMITQHSDPRSNP